MGTWWTWVLAGAGALIVLLVLSRRAFRAGVRRELIELMAQELPGVTLLEEAPEHLRLKLSDGAEGQVNLDRIYGAIASLGGSATLQDRTAIYREWVATLRESTGSSDPLDLETHGARVLPRIVPPGFFDELPPEAAIPHTPLGETGLAVAYVLDNPHSVSYLTRQHLDELGLDRARAHALALENLATRTPGEMLSQALGSEGIAVIKTNDTYDAARLLLVPSALKGTASVLAAIPDRDTLVLMPALGDDELEGARELAKTPGSDRVLFDRPLRVTRQGIALA